MGNWAITNLALEQYLDVLNVITGRDLDTATGFLSTPISPPTGALRWSRITNRWEEYDGLNWTGKILSVAGGGTGAGDAAGARAALGIGTMATQNSNAIAVTGGTISGVTAVGLSGHITYSANGQYNIGSSGNRSGRIYIGGGLVVPVGANKWVPTGG